MKMKLFKYLLDYIGQFLRIICPHNVFTLMRSIRNRIYTGYLRKDFKSLGESVIMWHPYTLMGTQYIEIGDNTIIEPDIQLTARKTNEACPILKIGSNCLIRRGAHITAINSIEIGNYVLTGTNVLITDNSHGNTDVKSLHQYTTQRKVMSKGKVKIGDNVWLGNNVCILAGVTIGEGAVIGANSVVTKDVPPYSVTVGIPAKIKNGKNIDSALLQ